MIPTNNVAPMRNVAVVTARDRPSRTYKIDFETGRVGGTTDGREAMEQAIAKILFTERFAHLIYSWSYGTELAPVLGKPFPVMEGEARRAIREAVLADSRVSAVEDITVTQVDKRTVAVRFTAVTRIGDIPIEREVVIGNV